MKNIIGCKLLISIFLLHNYAHSQLGDPQPKFHNYSVEDGLPGTETYFVHQDKKGYIWICTDRGVSRFDGYKFENFTMADGLADNVVFKIYEDYKGRLWFVSYNSFLSYYENGKIHTYKYNHLIEKASKVLEVAPQKMIHIDKNDKLYYSISYNGLFTIDKNGHLELKNKGKTINLERYDGQLMWNFYYSVHEKGPYQVVYYEKGKKQKVIDHAYGHGRWLITKLGGKDLFMGFDRLYDLSTGKQLLEQPGTICIYGDQNSNSLWIGSYKQGVIEIDELGHPEKRHQYLENLSVTSVLCDDEGGHWFTTLEKGVFYTPSLHVKNYSMQQGLIDDYVTSIAGIKDDIYLGFLLERWQNLRNSAFKTNKSLGSFQVQLGSSKKRFYISVLATHELNDGKVGRCISPRWTADYFYEPRGSVLFGIRDVSRIYDDGTLLQLYTYNNDQGIHKKNQFQALMSDEKGVIWLGFLTGLAYIENGSVSLKGLDNPLFKQRISDLACHPKWKNIAATRGEGIYFFENNKIFKQLKVKDGLLSDLINCIYLDEAGGIWAGTNNGVNYITKDKTGKINIQNFTSLHGLASNEVSCIYIYNKKVYVGTKAGLSVIDLNKFRRNKHICEIFVTQLETSTEKKNPLVHNTLSYRESYIKIGFRNSNYRTLKDGVFEYRFNSQSEWISTKTPEISLINPLPGEYNLEIRYRNEDGVWSKPKVVCSFTIDDAFYNKWYFFTALVLLTVIAGWLIFRLRIRQLKQRHRLHNKINQLEQKALQAQMNPHFIFNALNSIQSFLVYEENEKAEKYLLKFAQLIRQTLINSREPYITIESEIEVLEKYLDLERMRFKNKFKYKIEVELSASEMSLKIPNMLIQPFVENAVIHGFSTLDSGGVIDILLKRLDTNQIICIIEDNGIGRKRAMQQSSKKHVSFGTTITEERLKAFETKHGIHLKIETIDIENMDGSNGTRVIINLPVI